MNSSAEGDPSIPTALLATKISCSGCAHSFITSSSSSSSSSSFFFSSSSSYFEISQAKPLLRRGKEGLETLSDRRLKSKEGSSGKNKLLRMVRTSMACLREDDTARPSIGAAIKMLLRGQDSELPVFTGKSPQLRSDMTRHLNLAMKELSDVDETEVD